MWLVFSVLFVLYFIYRRYYIHNLVYNATYLLYTQRCANATNILYTQRRQMATLDAQKVLLLTNKTKLTLTVTLTHRHSNAKK